jgi:RNA polymerase sigma-70 factor (ECF subfamily)
VQRTCIALGVPEAECEDVVQEVFVRVHRRLPHYEERGRLLGWLAEITKCVVINLRASADGRTRRERIMSNDELERLYSSLPTHRSPIEDRAVQRHLVLRLLQEVDEDRCIVLLMHMIDGMTVREIAEDLGRPMGTVETQIQTARKEFIAAWKRHEARMQRETRGAMVLPIFGPLSLLETLREIPPMPEGAKERIWERLKKSTGYGDGDGGGGGGSGSGGSDAIPTTVAPRVSAPTVGIVAASAASVALGFALGVLWDPLHKTGESISARPDAMTITAPVVSSVAHLPGPPAPVAPSVAVAPPAAPSSSAAAVPSGLIEKGLMDRASIALARGDTTEALAAVEEHARRFHGGGALAELRETLWMQALLRAGRTGEARAKLARFAQIHPGNPALGALQTAAGAAP